MTLGRPRKSNDVKILEGTWRKDRHGEIEGALRADKRPVMPEGLSDDAQAFWKSQIDRLFETGRMSSEDGQSFQALCQVWSEYKKLQRLLTDMDPLSDEYGGLLRLYLAALKEYRCGAARFGLSPSDRAGMRVEAAKPAGVKARSRA